MKNITRKIVALLASAVTTVTTLSANYSEVFAETTQETAVSSADSDYEVKSGGLFGTFLSDEMNETVSGEQEKQSADYAVYKIDFNSDTGSFVADYKAVADCTLFIGFYNDEGTVLYTSIKKEIEASPNGQAEITVDVLLPENYLVKAFVIGANQEPLCKPKVYDKFTKAMQEILAKTTEDFEKDKVINLDENNENNFVVMNDGVIEITSSETVDTFVKTDDNGRHIFENAVEIAKLEKGSKAIVYTDYTIIAFVVGDIIKDGSMVTIVPSDADISEVFSFIKIDDSKYGKESKFLVDESNENNPNDVVYLGEESQEASAERKNAPGMPVNTRPQNKDEWEGTVELPNLSTTIPFALLKEDYFGNNEKSKNVIRDHEADVAATLSFGISVDLEIYYDVRIFGPKYVSITGTADISVEVSINCGIHKEWRLMPITIFTVGVASISIIPNVKLGAEAGATFSYTRTYDININSFTGPDWQSRDPIISKIEGKVTVDITFGLKIAVLIVGYDVFAIDLDAGVRLEVSTDYFESHTEYMKHQCKNCVGFSISFIFDISLTIDLFSLEDWTWDLLEVEIPLGKWYCSSDIGWGKNECPNKYHQVCVTIKDKKTKKPIKGVKLYDGYQALPDYLIKLDNGQANVSDSEGKIKFWVNDSAVSDDINYCVTALTDNKDRGYCVIGKDFDRESRKLQNYTIYIKTKSSGSDKEDESNADSDSDEDAGSFWPIIGNCGKRRTDVSDDITIYDDVYYRTFVTDRQKAASWKL